MIRDNLPSHHQRKKYAFGQTEFVTVKVQGILVTCIHLRNGEESDRIKEWTRIWEKLKWMEFGAKHIFAGDFNSLTWEDKEEGEWARVAEGHAAVNLELDEAISLSKKKQDQGDQATSRWVSYSNQNLHLQIRYLCSVLVL